MKRLVTLRPRGWNALALKWVATILAPPGRDLFLAVSLQDRLSAWAALAHIVGDRAVREILLAAKDPAATPRDETAEPEETVDDG